MAQISKMIMQTLYGNSKNFMTPHNLRYGKVNEGLVYESSEGSGIFGWSTIYALTFALFENGRWVKERDATVKGFTNVFRTKEARAEYLNELRRE